MPQFPRTPDRERILDKIPDYAVELSASPSTIVLSLDGVEMARSSAALLVRETRHADVYYLPRRDVNMALLKPTDHSTYCPFKGYASYWSATVNDKIEENLVWSYEDPFDEVGGIKDYLSFYADRVEIQVV